MPNDGLRGFRLANLLAFVCGITLATATLILVARCDNVDPFHSTGPQALSRLSTGSTIALFGFVFVALLFGMILGSTFAPQIFGYGRWDRIDDLDASQLVQVTGEGLVAKCPACGTPNRLVVSPPNTPGNLAPAAVVCSGCGSAIRARITGNLLALGTFANKTAVRKAQERHDRV